jgi:two-component system sensor histidine kinase/response regulator
MRSKLTEPEVPAAGMAPDAVLASMDHQIHTSMNGVIGMLELLHGTELTADQREFIGMAQVSAENLLKLFDGMLDFSKLSAGKLALERLPFDLFREVDAACAPHRTAAAGKGLRLQVHSAPDIQRFMIGDALRIGQVMTTLIGNAVECSANGRAGGQVRVDIESIGQQDGRCRLCVCISDSGTGGDEFTGIFNGSRGIAPVNPQHGPMQIGLALCKSLVELMDGQCGAVHEPETGRKFWFTLNLPLAAGVLAGVRVLLVDDQPSVRRVFEQQLKQQAMRADSFGSAAAALGALAEAQTAGDPYRIAILNHKMADMDGETLGAAIKADPACSDILLVLLTPESSLAYADRYSQSGFAACIGKPVSRQTLLDTLAILCARLDSKKTLPFVADAVMQAPRRDAAPAAQPLAGHRVLVVDDNHANNQVARHMLEKLGCRVELATDGSQAVALHGAVPYDLILMDCQMPGLDGYQASAMIRAAEADARTGRTPIIACTTSALPDERKKCIDAGMDDLIAKPVRPQILQEALARWLRPETPDAEGQADELESMRDLFGSSFAELAALYRNDVPKRLEALLAASATDDAEQMAKVAHSLSGSCASIGATRLATLCQALEVRCKAGFIEDFGSRLDVIRAEYGRIETKLRTLVQSIEV